MTLDVESPHSSPSAAADDGHPAAAVSPRRVALLHRLGGAATPGLATGPGSLGPDALAAILLSLATFGLYVLTLAPTVLRSDSGEFHVVPWVLGIAHPPGYPLLTLLARLAMFLPIGDPAYRVNLLDAAAAAATIGLVYLTVTEVAGGNRNRPKATGHSNGPVAPSPITRHPSPSSARVGGLAAAAALGLGATYWQQSVVGGPRPLSFFFTALLLCLLFRWGNRQRSSDLVLLAAAAGFSLAHHTNQVMFLPALALYLLGRDPRLVLRTRQVALATLAFLAPLLLYLYVAIRSTTDPPLGALDLLNLRDLAIYLSAGNYQNSVLANCASVTAGLQARRFLVFLMLQFGPLLSIGAAFGALVTLVRAPLAGLALLYIFGSNAGFGICSTLAMPDYIVPSYVVAATWLGLGLAWILQRLGALLTWQKLSRATPPGEPAPKGWRLAASVLASGLVLGLIAYRLATGLPAQNMGSRTLDGERARAGMAHAEPRVLVLSDWESVTPIWYAKYVEGLGRRTNTAIVTAPPESDTWLIETEKGLDGGRVALAQPVPALGDKYRLFPIGSLFDVTEKAVVERGTNQGLLAEDRTVRVLGYRLDRPLAAPGELVHLTLYQRAERGRDASYLPVLRLAGNPPVEFSFGQRLYHPPSTWVDGEVVGEVYEFSLPAWLPPGELPIELAYHAEASDALVGVAGGRPWLRLGSVQVTPSLGSAKAAPQGSLANFSDQLALLGGAVGRGNTRSELAAGPLRSISRTGGVLDLELRWSALRWMDEGYTLFVHLLDGEHRLVSQSDALPLGGVYHTYKWVPGQVITDWYRLALPPELPPGAYWLEIGAYQSVSTRRLLLLNPQGGAEHASFLWGPLQVE